MSHVLVNSDVGWAAIWALGAFTGLGGSVLFALSHEAMYCSTFASLIQ